MNKQKMINYLIERADKLQSRSLHFKKKEDREYHFGQAFEDLYLVTCINRGDFEDIPIS